MPEPLAPTCPALKDLLRRSPSERIHAIAYHKSRFCQAKKPPHQHHQPVRRLRSHLRIMGYFRFRRIIDSEARAKSDKVPGSGTSSKLSA